MRMRSLIPALFAYLAVTAVRADPIRMDLSFASDAWYGCAVQAPFELFSFYVLIEGAPPMWGWEMTVDSDGFYGGGLSVLGIHCHPQTALCMEYLNFIVALGACIDPGALGLLATVDVGWFASEPFGETWICAGPTVPSSFEGLPGIADCQDQLLATEFANPGPPAGCIVLNPIGGCTPLATAASSFSTVKARYSAGH